MHDTPTLARRAACLFYDALLLAAVLFFSGFILVGVMPQVPTTISRVVHQLYFLLVGGLYFVWCWRRGGQTLAMKTWRIRLVAENGGPPSLRQAWLRYVLAVFGYLALGLGFFWAIWDRDGRFLHDRLAGTRLILDARGKAGAAQ